MTENLVMVPDPTVKDLELERRSARAEFASRLFVVITIVGVSAILVLLSVLVVQIRHQQVNAAPVLVSTQHAARDAAATALLVKSCVDPKGSCYKDSQARTGQAIGTLSETTITAAACAANLAPRYAALPLTAFSRRIAACVKLQLTHHH